ncbi:DNA polymerase iota-like isoform X2 [Branchiostoma floridae x Branchiostoma belcheri]
MSSWKRKYEEIDDDDDTDKEEEDAEEDWGASMDDDSQKQNQSDKMSRRLSTSQHTSGEEDTSRVIVHIDVDCFYAQVEMIRDPTLRDKPLGIQQKNIVVTCNYVARKRGVTKLMFIKQAKELCPELVLVKGEDLTHYREMSYKITEALQKFSPLVERLGFDENFVDVTETVHGRVKSASSPQLNGYIFPEKKIEGDLLKDERHVRLACGSQIAAEMRQTLHSELGITCCAGIAHNKLLAKLVAGQHKPNQQTTLLPEGVGQLMGTLKTVRNIPGIGSSTFKRLQTLGISAVQDLQDAPANVLQVEFGAQTAQVMQQLCHGVDPSPVILTGPPQTISDEDSFKKCASLQNAKERMTGLLQSLMKRLKGDGRIPHVLRVTVRKLSATNKWTNRESRQCAIHSHVFGTWDDNKEKETISQLLDLCVVLFCKMVDVNQPFHLTLINICFAKLEARSKQLASIKNFFQNEPTSTQTLEKSTHMLQHLEDAHILKKASQQPHRAKSSRSSIESFFRPQQRSSSYLEFENKTRSGTLEETRTCRQITATVGSSTSVQSFFTTKDRDVEYHTSESRSTESCSSSTDIRTCKQGLSFQLLAQTHAISSASDTEASPLSRVQTLPSGIDPDVFSELPPEIQREICANCQKTEDTDRNLSTSQSVDQESQNNAETPNVSDSMSRTVYIGEVEEMTSEVENTHTSSCTKPASVTVPVEGTVLPPDIDPAVFAQLPREMRVELLNSWRRNSSSADSTQTDRKPQSRKTGKSTSIAKYFKKMNS